MPRTDSDGRRRFGQAGHSADYDAVPPSEADQLAASGLDSVRSPAETSLQLVDGQWVEVPASLPPLRIGPESSNGGSVDSAPTYRAPHGRNESIPPVTFDGQYKVFCGVDWLTLFIYPAEIAKWSDVHNKFCPDGAVATFKRLIEWREANDETPQAAAAQLYGGSGIVKSGYPVYGKHVRCELEFRCEGIKIALADPETYTDSSKPIGQVIISGQRLTRTGHLNAIAQTEVLLKGLGLKDSVLKVSRIDVRADVLNCPVREFLAYAFRGGASVMNFKPSSAKTWGAADSLETVAWGKSNRIRLQLYDKIHSLHELAGRGYEREAIETWANLCGRYGEVPQSLLRCEFQIAKDWIKEHYGVETIGDVLGKLDHMVEHVYTEQFRVLDRAKDRESRNYTWRRGQKGLHPIWASVIEGTRDTDFGADLLSCEVAERVRSEKSVKSKLFAERRMNSALENALAMSMSAEDIEVVCSSAEGIANFAARLAVASSLGCREKIRDRAVRRLHESAAADLLPHAAWGEWSDRSVPGFDVQVYSTLLEPRSVVPPQAVPF